MRTCCSYITNNYCQKSKNTNIATFNIDEIYETNIDENNENINMDNDIRYSIGKKKHFDEIKNSIIPNIMDDLILLNHDENDMRMVEFNNIIKNYNVNYIKVYELEVYKKTYIDLHP